MTILACKTDIIYDKNTYFVKHEDEQNSSK